MLIYLLIQTNICFNGESNIMECEATGSNDFKLVLIMDLFIKNIAFHFTQLELTYWSHVGYVEYCDAFKSCLDSHSDGARSLQRIHWWGRDIMLNVFKSDEETNSPTSWRAWGWVHFQWIVPLRNYVCLGCDYPVVGPMETFCEMFGIPVCKSHFCFDIHF